MDEDPEGVSEMCAIMEDWRKESEERGRYERTIEVAQNMLGMGLGSLDDIVKVTGLSIDKVRELAGHRTASGRTM